MKILVTGAYGQLGSEIKEISIHFPNWQFLFTDVDSLDITSTEDVEQFMKENQPDYLINCAAYTAVDKAETDKDNAKKINATAPGILAKIARETGTKMIHVSTDYVFSGTGFRPYSETDKTDPQGVYGKTKLDGEQLCISENEEVIIIRTSWLYSAFGNNFVKTMLRLGTERDSLKVVYDQVGSPTYAADLAKVLLEIIKLSEKEHEKFVPGIYHYSNEGAISWYDFSKAIFEIAGLGCNVFPVLSEEFPTPTKRPNYSVLNKSKIKNIFGLQIPYWRDSLQVCIDKIEK